MRLFVIAAILLSPLAATAQYQNPDPRGYPVPDGMDCPGSTTHVGVCPTPPVPHPQPPKNEATLSPEELERAKYWAAMRAPIVPAPAAPSAPLFTPPPAANYHELQEQPPRPETPPPPIVNNAPPKQTGNGYEQMRRGMSAAPIKPLAQPQAKPLAPKSLFKPYVPKRCSFCVAPKQ
ncbi:MAG: hypothetical protein ACLPZF_11265 [Candidatus Acidiferrales bacterium]